MILYLVLLAFVYLAAQVQIINQGSTSVRLTEHRFDALWSVTFIFLVLVVGLRHDVGGDWDNYWLRFTAGPIFNEDPAYYGLLTWLVQVFDLPIYFLNLLCAAISLWCLSIWYKSSQYKWLILLASIPYLIPVVQMGYTRQGVAISIVSLAYYFLIINKFKLFLFAVSMASLFHSSAMVFFLLPILCISLKNSLFAVAGLTGFLGIVLLFSEVGIDFNFLKMIYTKLSVYIEVEQSSSGAIIRGIMGFTFSIIAAIFMSRKILKDIEVRMIAACCVIFFILVCLSIFTSFNTIFDRIALYLIPIYLYYFVHNTMNFFESGADQILLTSIFGIFNIIILTIVVNFGSNMFFYRNYTFWPFFMLFGNTECVSPDTGRCDKGHF